MNQDINMGMIKFTNQETKNYINTCVINTRRELDRIPPNSVNENKFPIQRVTI